MFDLKPKQRNYEDPGIYELQDVIDFFGGYILCIGNKSSLETLSFCDDHIGRNYAKLIFMALLDASSAITTLELLENNISGWLSDFRCNSSSQALLAVETSKSLKSLRVLNLRGNNFQKNDLEDLRYALVYMPVLETLDLADNPFEDEGVKCLIPYFAKTFGKSSLAGKVLLLILIFLKNCKLTCNGAAELLEVLLALKYPLSSLSLADNDLGRLDVINSFQSLVCYFCKLYVDFVVIILKIQMAPLLGDFMHTSIRSLDIRDINLGSSGFLELRMNMQDVVKLININISENRGGI